VNVLIIVLIILGALLLAGLGIWMLVLSARAQDIRPCYRCATVATHEFMGLYYCRMCCMIVVKMLPVVRHDPPYGFPGSSGHLMFPEEAKKEG
jgi:hypothetical protein